MDVPRWRRVAVGDLRLTHMCFPVPLHDLATSGPPGILRSHETGIFLCQNLGWADFVMRCFIATLVAVQVAVASLAGEVAAAPEARLWERWTAHDPMSQMTVDHAVFDRLLEDYVHPSDDGVNRFDYGAVSDADRQALSDYVHALALVNVSMLNRPQQFAYWVNLYNALTLKVVLDNYSVASIRDIDISPGFFADGPWGAKLLMIEGEAVSLDDIEHRILRPIWRDQRIHYAVNCASVGCPNLWPEAMKADADLADRQMDEQASAFVNHPRGARISEGSLRVSSIYDWFDEDFGGTEAGVIGHLKRHAAPALLAELEGIERISGDDYDWSLNDTQ